MRLFTILIIMCCHSGCVFYPSDSSGYGYVDRNRTPEEIGEWAVSTNDSTRVRHAQLALYKYSDPNYKQATSEEREQAIDATLRIYNKYMSGQWELAPTNNSLTSPTRIPWATYEFLACAAQLNERARRFFFEIEPVEDNLRSEWTKAGQHYGLVQ